MHIEIIMLEYSKMLCHARYDITLVSLTSTPSKAGAQINKMDNDNAVVRGMMYCLFLLYKLLIKTPYPNKTTLVVRVSCLNIKIDY